MKTKFYPNGRRIIGVFEPELNIRSEIFKRCTNPTWNILNRIIDIYDLEINSTFTGVANCNNEEAYDEKYGKGLAEQKAMLKYHKSMSKKYKKMIDILRKALDEAAELEVRHYRKVRNIEEDYRKYYLGE